MSELIDKQAVLKVIRENSFIGFQETEALLDAVKGMTAKTLVHCKDCKYRDDNLRRKSVKWLPCMEVLPYGNWYCGSAERKQDD